MPVPTDDLGTPVPLGAPPRRLVSLVPNLTETLWWWHLADRVVGRTEWCTAPPGGFPAAATVRGTKNPDVRAIAELAPDLVVANEEENRELDVRRLRDLGIPVWVTRVRTLADAERSWVHLAAALGVAGAGIDLANTVRRARSRARTGRPVRAFVPIWRGLPAGDDGAERWMAVGAASVAADVLAAGGFEVVHGGPAGDDRYPVTTVAQALAADVEVALLTDEPYAFGDDDAAELRAAGLRVRHVDGTGLFWWGPRTPMVLADLRRLARHLHRRR
ncbi:cobalamin-binding protein [Nitriliruptoraceae bacterium ZYF776]|nr:cobalamin-binding protein [Profundirhabdus halotolerans]